MGDEKLAKRADVQKVEVKMRRGRLKLQRGIALKETYKSGEKSYRQKELETAERERSERKVKGRH